MFYFKFEQTKQKQKLNIEDAIKSTWTRYSSAHASRIPPLDCSNAESLKKERGWPRLPCCHGNSPQIHRQNNRINYEAHCDEI